MSNELAIGRALENMPLPEIWAELKYIRLLLERIALAQERLAGLPSPIEEEAHSR